MSANTGDRYRAYYDMLAISNFEVILFSNSLHWPAEAGTVIGEIGTILSLSPMFRVIRSCCKNLVIRKHESYG